MSHTTRLNAIQIRSVNALRGVPALLKSLHGIDCSLVENATPRAYYAAQEGMGKADFVLKLNGSRYDLGLYKQADGTFEVRTDFWGQDVERILGVVRSADAKADSMQHKLGKFYQAYGTLAAEEQCRRQGKMVTRQITADGRIKLVVNGF